ncbi:MAG: Uma2 family endonuclease, partial [Saprospiraceae bacterium]
EITEQIKAEFINGEIIVHSPVIKLHNDISSNAHRLIDAYVFERDLGFVGIEKILIQLTRNDYEPDVCFFDKQKTNQFKDNQKFFPAPDLIVEVLSKSTEKRDRGIKFKDYEAHGVTEYWIIDPKNKTIKQYVLKKNKYELVTKSTSEKVFSKALTGLDFSVAALFSRKENYAAVKAILKGK